MSIVRYDPFRDLRSLQEEVNRLFSTNLTRGFGEEGIGRGAWNPSVDIYENKDQIVLEAELPGMNRDDFELTVENNVITLRGEVIRVVQPGTTEAEQYPAGFAVRLAEPGSDEADALAALITRCQS